MVIETKIQRPLLIASSGGGGHIAAAKGILDELAKKRNIDLIQHTAVQYKERQPNIIRLLFQSILYIKSFKLISRTWEWLHTQLYLTNVLEYNSFYAEINTLTQSNQQQPTRPYIDLLIDFYAFGYEMTAIFNSLQRRDDVKQLLSTVKKQHFSDEIHYRVIKKRMINLLIQQTQQGKPYTEIISTQPQSLKAICAAAMWYNEYYIVQKMKQLQWIHARKKILSQRIETMTQEIQNISNSRSHYVQYLWLTWIRLPFLASELTHLNAQQKSIKILKPLRIKQYLTDLPTAGATHFLSSLTHLTRKQRSLMDLHTVDIKHNVLDGLKGFNIIRLPPEQNPMVRTGFKQTQSLLQYCSNEDEHRLNYNDNSVLKQRIIPKNDPVAAIMLGSLGSDACAEYIQPLLNQNYRHIFVFGAQNNPVIQKAIHTLSPANQQRIIALGHQTDNIIAPIMTRSDCVITRCGGLSTMEHMALPLRKSKRLFIHHKNPTDTSNTLTSGLSWEDGNADYLIEHCKQRGAQAIKTCPATIADDLLPRTSSVKLEASINNSLRQSNNVGSTIPYKNTPYTPVFFNQNNRLSDNEVSPSTQRALIQNSLY